MDSIKVTICTGTTCYVMGAAELLTLQDQLPPELAPLVEIEGSPCLDLCKDDQYGGAPFVKVGQTTLTNATPERVLAEIRQQVAKRSQA